MPRAERAKAEIEERAVAYDRTVVLPEPMPHQHELILDPARFKIGICGRRWGKTVAGRCMALVGHGPTCRERRGVLYGAYGWWVMPSLPAARETWDAFEFALRDVWIRKNATERFFDLPGGGRLQIKSSDEPESLRGAGLDFVVFDEIKDHHKKTWKVVRPALSDKMGWMLAIGTPPEVLVEDNLAVYLYNQASSAGRNGWRAWQLPSAENPILTADELDEMRLDLGELGFARECLAQFVVASGGKFRPEWFRYYECSGDRVWLGLASVASSELTRFATCDLAASNKTYSDYTVVASWAVTPDRQLLLLDVLRAKLDGAQVFRAMAEAKERHKLAEIYVETNAYETKFIAMARAQGLPIHELVPDRDKVTRAQASMADMEAGKIWLPRDAGRWLEDFKAELLCFSGHKGERDDQVDALAYASLVARRVGDLGAAPVEKKVLHGMPTMGLQRPPSLRPGGR